MQIAMKVSNIQTKAQDSAPNKNPSQKMSIFLPVKMRFEGYASRE
jgi:hypothetical protein